MALAMAHRHSAAMTRSSSVGDINPTNLSNQDRRLLDLPHHNMYKQADYYDDRNRLNFTYDDEPDTSVGFSAPYHHDSNYYSRCYRQHPYARGSRSLTPQGSDADLYPNGIRKRIAVAVRFLQSYHNHILHHIINMPFLGHLMTVA
jgi:hypothetical protein